MNRWRRDWRHCSPNVTCCAPHRIRTCVRAWKSCAAKRAAWIRAASRGCVNWRAATARAAPMRAGNDAEAGRLLAWAWPDRVAQRRRSGRAYGRAALPACQRARRGIGAGVHAGQAPSTWWRWTWMMPRARWRGSGLAAPLTRAQLEAALGNQVTEARRDRSGYQVRRIAFATRAASGRAWCLSEQRVETDPEQLLAALMAQLQRSGLEALPWSDASRRLLARLRFVAAQAGTGGSATDFPRMTTLRCSQNPLRGLPLISRATRGWASCRNRC